MTPEELKKRLEELRQQFDELERESRHINRLKWLSRIALVMTGALAITNILTGNVVGAWGMVGGAILGSFIGWYATLPRPPRD